MIIYVCIATLKYEGVGGGGRTDIFDGHTFSVVARHGRFNGESVVIGVYKYRADVDIPACGGMHFIVTLESPYRTVRMKRRKEGRKARTKTSELMEGN